jgi:hypothetical protein
VQPPLIVGDAATLRSTNIVAEKQRDASCRINHYSVVASAAQYYRFSAG